MECKTKKKIVHLINRTGGAKREISSSQHNWLHLDPFFCSVICLCNTPAKFHQYEKGLCGLDILSSKCKGTFFTYKFVKEQTYTSQIANVSSINFCGVFNKSVIFFFFFFLQSCTQSTPKYTSGNFCSNTQGPQFAWAANLLLSIFLFSVVSSLRWQNGMSICNGKMSQFPQHLPNTTNMFLTRHLFQWAIKLTRFCEHQEKENRCLFSEQAHRTHSIFLNTNHAQHTSNQAANVFSQPPIHTAGKLASKTRALISV